MIEKREKNIIEQAQLEFIDHWSVLIDKRKLPKDILEVFTNDDLADELADGIFQIERKHFPEIRKKIKETKIVDLSVIKEEELEDENFLMDRLIMKNWYDLAREEGVPKTENKLLKLFLRLYSFEKQEMEFIVNGIFETTKTETHIFFKAKCIKKREAVRMHTIWIEEFEVLAEIKKKVFPFLNDLTRLTLNSYQQLSVFNFNEKQEHMNALKAIRRWGETGTSTIRKRIMPRKDKKDRGIIYGSPAIKGLLKADELFLKRFDVVDFILTTAGRSKLLRELYLEFLMEEKKIRKAKLLLKFMKKTNNFNITEHQIKDEIGE